MVFFSWTNTEGYAWQRAVNAMIMCKSTMPRTQYGGIHGRGLQAAFTILPFPSNSFGLFRGEVGTVFEFAPDVSANNAEVDAVWSKWLRVL